MPRSYTNVHTQHNVDGASDIFFISYVPEWPIFFQCRFYENKFSQKEHFIICYSSVVLFFTSLAFYTLKAVS